MDIGTGKDLEEYVVDGVKIPYHLIDIKEPGYKYNIGEFQQNFTQAYLDIDGRNKPVILCGGSGLYIETALNGNSFLGIPANVTLRESFEKKSDADLRELYEALPHSLKEKLNSETRRRIIRAIEVNEFKKENPDWEEIKPLKLNYTIIGLDIDRELRREKITKRLSHRLNHGMIEEVQTLLDQGLKFEDLEWYGLEYKWLGLYLKGDISKKEMFERLNVAIHQFAKRQMTWFRRMEKNGYHIHWIDASKSLEEKKAAAIQLI